MSSVRRWCSLARSEDADLRQIGLERLRNKKSWSETERPEIIGLLPELPWDALFDFLRLRTASPFFDGDAPGVIVDRLAEGWPKQMAEQPWWWMTPSVEHIAEGVGPNAFADLFGRIASLLPPGILERCAAMLDGCPELQAIAPLMAVTVRPGEPGLEVSDLVALLPVRPDPLGVVRELRRIAMQTGFKRLDIWKLTRKSELPALLALADELWLALLDCVSFEAKSLGSVLSGEQPSALDDEERLQRLLRPHVSDWVAGAADDPERTRWFLEGVRRARNEGADWDAIGYAFPGLLDLIAREFARDDPPYWAISVLRQRIEASDRQAWTDLFRYLERYPSAIHRRYSDTKALLFAAPLPEDASDDFDESFFATANKLQAFEYQQIASLHDLRGAGDLAAEWKCFLASSEGSERPMVHPAVAHDVQKFRPLVDARAILDRLSGLPMTQQRARRLVALLEKQPDLIRHPSMPALAPLAAPMAPTLLAAVDLRDWADPETLPVLLALGGNPLRAQMRERIRTWIRGLDQGVLMAPRRRWGNDVYPATIALLMDDALAHEARQTLSSTLAELTSLQLRSLQGEMPWLVRVEDLQRALVSRAEVADDGWLTAPHSRLLGSDGSKWIGDVLGSEHMEAVERRAAVTASSEELVYALRWLVRHNAPRRRVLHLGIGGIARTGAKKELMLLVAEQLPTRSAWESAGRDFWRALLANEVEHWTWPFEFAGAQIEADRRSLLPALHLTLASVIVDLATHHARLEDWPAVEGLLGALLHTDPPPVLVRELAPLRKLIAGSERAAALAKTAVDLFKDDAGRSPSYEGLAQALKLAADVARPQRDAA